MIEICTGVSIDKSEIHETFIQAGGPGGQNVNKLATAAQLRFDARTSPNLPRDVRERLEKLAGKRATQDGVIVITARRHRTQERNRADALERLIELIERASERPSLRRKTRPSLGVVKRRWEAKSRRSNLKRDRRSMNGSE